MSSAVYVKRISLLLLALLWCWRAAGREEVSAFDALRRENAQLRTQLIKQNAELARLRLWLAGMVSGSAELPHDQTERVLLARFNEVIGNGKNLSVKVAAAVRELRQLLAQAKLNDAARIQYSMLLDELEQLARSFSAVAVGGSEQSKNLEMRIISLDSKLHIAVVSGGLREGIFPGMLLYPVNFSNDDLRLRVIGVRSGACVVDLAGGKWSDVTPGMALTPFRKRR